ncbi:diguanylate cyclase [Pseudomonas putida]|uniref:Diguanylate cyclase n=1 Tax=Pseudomonas putida TaxID=303 RepID=A0A4D6X597_PSEPU|nr:diguanylate cyclase [Pseudomonas putida]
MGAGSPANTGEAGAIHRGVCFAGKPAPTGSSPLSRSVPYL